MHRRNKRMKKKICLLILASLLFLSAGCSGNQDVTDLAEADLEDTKEAEDKAEEAAEESAEIQEEENQGETTNASDILYVHVCGEVADPGVYILPAGSRIYEAIEAAGGLTAQAAGESLNQAAEVEDGQQVYVLSREEAAQCVAAGTGGIAQNGAGADTGGQNQEDEKVSLNTASKEQLMTLNGIGEAKAAAIIRYREEHNGFQKLEELMEVEGIKEGTYNKIKDQIKM